MCIHISLSPGLLPSRPSGSSQNPELSFPCIMAGSHQLSAFYRIVYVHQPFAEMWMDPDSVIESEGSQREKSTRRVLMHVYGT